MTGKRMLIDTSKCTACRACQVACKQWHSLPSENTTFTGSYTNPPDNSGANLTVVKFTEAEVGGKLRFLFFNNRCRHCDPTGTGSGPYCVGACTAHAIIRQKNGIVRIDPALCRPPDGTGAFACGTYDPKPCWKACPYGIPHYKYEMAVDPVETVARKCDFCYNRFTDAKLKARPYLISPTTTPAADFTAKSALPACQVTCPPGAISSGNATKLADPILKKARARVKYLKTHGYPNANVYPPQDGGLGPTHMIWVLLEDRSVYGL